MNGSRRKTGLVAVVALAALVVGSHPSHAQEKGWNINGSGVWNKVGLGGEHNAIGNATHLGKYSGIGAVDMELPDYLDDETGILYGHFQSAVPFTFQGATGDILTCTYGVGAEGEEYQGTYQLVPDGPGLYVAYWVAEFRVVAGTGKFAGASGSWIMYAQSEPLNPFADGEVKYSWQGKGKLTFQK